MTKFRVMLDVGARLHESIREVAVRSLGDVEDLPRDQQMQVYDERFDLLDEAASRWVSSGMVTIEFDTDAGTATVVEVGK